MTLAHLLAITLAVTVGLIMLKLGVDFSEAMREVDFSGNSQR